MNRLWHSIRFRLIASIVLIVSIVFSLFIWDHLATVKTTHSQHLEVTTQNAIQHIVNAVGNYMIAVDYASLEEFLNGLMQQYSLKYILVLDKDQRAVVTLGSLPELSDLNEDTSPLSVDDGVFDVSEEIIFAGRPMGQARIGVSIASMQNAMSTARIRHTVITLIGFILTSLVTIFLGVRFTHRLGLLAKAAGKVGQGEYNVSIPIGDNDEIGITAKAFNQMVEQVNANQQRLKDQTRRNELILHNSLDGFWVVGLDGSIREVNDAYCEMVGYTREELMGMHISDVEAVEQQEHIKKHINSILKKGYDRFETQHRKKDKSLIDLAASVRLMELNNEQFIFAFLRDITARKIAEQELQKHRDQLEQLVTERTAALQESNKELESYSYSIAHDLRSPLRTITSFSQILMEDIGEKLTQEDQENLQRIVKAGKQMAQLIDDILQLSRITRSELQIDNVDLTQLCKRIIANFNGLNSDRKISWKVQDNLKVTGDSRLLEIALQNLLENAWKYSSKNINAEIQIGANNQNGDIIYFVKDNGVGFDMKYVDKLFKPFHRLHTPEDFQGTGIGLATVQRIVHRHNGRIWSEGEINDGATFYFTLGVK